MRSASCILSSIILCCILPSVVSGQLNTSLPLVASAQSYTHTTTDEFMLQGLQFTPADTVFIQWDHTTQLFSVYGVATVPIGNFPIRLSLGSVVEPAIIIDSDTVANAITMHLVDSFSIHLLRYEAVEGETLFRYDFDADQYEITGDAQIVLSGNTYDVGLGNSNSPGVIWKPGGVTRILVNLDVNSSFDLHGMTAVDPSIVLSWKTGNNNTYHGFGHFGVLIQDGYYSADAGTNANPGITIVDGKVKDVKINVIGGALLFGALPTYGVFNLQYHQTRHVYVMNGQVVVGIPLGTLANLPQLSIDTGDPDSGGIEYHTDSKKLHVESATFEVRNIGGSDVLGVLGGFQLKELSVTIQDNVPVDINGLMILPMGVALGADFQFTYDPDNHSLPFFIHSITLEWEALNVTSAIPMGETGFFLVKIEGTLSELDKPSQLELTATLGFTFGEVISCKIPVIGTQELAPFYFEATASFSAHHLEMDVTGDIGAKVIGSQWEGLLGEAEVDLDFVFGKRFTMTGTISMPSDPLLIATAEAIFSKGDVDLLASAQLIVPHFIPIIGGKTFGNVHGAVRMKKNDPHNSFTAGWMRLNLVFDHVHLGALYNVGTGNIHKIGAGAQKDIQTTIENDIVDPPQGDPPPNYWICELRHDFTIEGNLPAAYLQSHLRVLNTGKFVDPDNGDVMVTARIESLDPDYPNLEAYRPGDSTNIFPPSPGLDIGTDGIVTINLNDVDSAAWIAANHGAEIYGVINWPAQPEVLLTPGTHTMILQGYCPLNVGIEEEDISFTTSPAYPRPTVMMDMVPVWTADVFYSFYLTDSVDVSVFFSHDTSRNGQLIERFGYLFGDPLLSMPGYRYISYAGLNQILPPMADDSVYFYAAANDYVNPIVYSEPVLYLPAGTHEISGYIRLPDGTPVEGVPVVMFRDTMPGDRLATYTDVNGRYAFYNCVRNTPIVIQAFATAGHNFTPEAEVSKDFISRQLRTTDLIEVVIELQGDDNVTADFTLIDEPVSIYGAIYDTDNNSIAGATVFLYGESGNLITQHQTNEFGFTFFGFTEGIYHLEILLPTDTNGYHWPSSMIYSTADIKALTDNPFTFSGAPLRFDYHAHSGQGPFFVFQDADTGIRLKNCQIELLPNGMQEDAVFSTVSTITGVVGFDEQDLQPDVLYDIVVTPNPSHHCETCPTQYMMSGNPDLVLIELKMD